MTGDAPGAPGTGDEAGTARRWGIDEARRSLYELVDAAAAGETTLIGRGAKAAALCPLDHLDPGLQAHLPSTPVTSARKKLGDLLAAAAAGRPQLLSRRRTPAAVLLPAPSADPSPTAVPATPETAEQRPDAGTEPPTSPRSRRLHGLGDVLGEALAPASSPTGPTLSFGLETLDAALTGLTPGRLTLVAAAPGAGGSLLAVAAARHTALARQRPVLYAASGLTRADIAARIIAAETPVDYRRLRTGTLTTAEEQAAADTRARLTGAPLYMDDGTGLTADAITETAPDIDGLALVVVDRLQHAHDPAVPLSGPALPAATQALARLARTRDLPVLAVLDTDTPDAVAALNADITLTLTRDDHRTQVVISERDFGPLATIALHADLRCARFTDTPAAVQAPGGPPDDAVAGTGLAATEAELLEAARPFTSGAQQGLSARLTGLLAALRESASAAATGHTQAGHTAGAHQENGTADALPELRQALTEAALRTPHLPDTGEGQRLAAALQAFAAAHRPRTPDAENPPAAPAHSAAAVSAPAPVATAPRPAPASEAVGRRGDPAGPPGRTGGGLADTITDAVADALEQHGGDADAATAGLVKRAIPDVMALFKASRVGGRYEHSEFPPTQDILKKRSQKEADSIWEGRPKWRNTALLKAVRSGETGPVDVTALDMNAAYLSAMKTHLPIGKLTHDTSGLHDTKRSGVYLVTPSAWGHGDLPNPLGNRQEPGPLWLTEPTLRLLLRCTRENLCEAPVIHESWTSGSTEGLLEKLRRTLADTRRTAIDHDDEVTLEYVKAMYSKFVSTIGESTANREIRRPDWMHIIRSQAFANLWLKAYKAHTSGLTVVEMSGTDELHLAGDWRQVFPEGRNLNEVKAKHHYTLGEK
ncbi:type II toxin-antitoxin system prevent-host-death family antitoxin [Streptomyces sp. NPDC002537]